MNTVPQRWALTVNKPQWQRCQTLGIGFGGAKLQVWVALSK